MPAPLYKKGDELGEGLHLNRWKVVRKIGEGQFAEVYEVVDAFKDNKRCAFKVERTLEAKTVKAEARVLKSLQSCLHVVRLVEQGSIDGRSFMVMELLGMNVSDARRSCSTNGRWGVDIMKHIGQHMLEAIAGVHRLGFIHRDIKPANFALTPRHAPPSEGAWHVLDFGLARKFTDEEGSVMGPRDRKEFRGSTSYASVAAHKLQDLGRRDDLWSWLYVLVEMLDGTLPWRGFTTDRGATQRMKEECVADPQRLCSHVVMPGPLVEISKHLAGLSFADAPDYEFLHGCLHRLTDAQAKPRAAASGRSLMPALDGYPLPPHSLSGRTAAPASVAAGSHASLRAPDLIPSFLTFEAVNGHHLPDVGTIAPSSTLGAAPGAGLYPGGDANGVQPVFIADTPRSPPEESDLLYDDLPGVRSAPPPLSAESPPSATLPSPIIMMPVGKPSGQHADHRNEATQEAARQRGVRAPAHPLQRSASEAAGPLPAGHQRRDEVVRREHADQQGSRATSSPRERPFDHSSRDRPTDETSRKRRAPADARRGDDEVDGIRKPDKRRDVDGDRPWREVDRHHYHSDHGGREHSARRRRDSSERQHSERAAVSGDATQAARSASSHFSRIRECVDRVRTGHVSRYARQAHGALQGVEEPNEVIGIIAAFMQDSYEGAGALRVLGELTTFIAAEEGRNRTSL